MCSKSIYFISFILVLSIVAPSMGADPDPSLMGWWTFDGHALDSSGNDRHGTLHGNPQFVPGVSGEAMEFQPNPDYVTIDSYKGILGTHAFSITAWVRTTNTAIEQIVHWGTQSNNQRVEFRIDSNRLRISHGGGNVQGNTDLIDGEWHHVAAAVIENATASSGDVTFYVDGEDDTMASTDPDGWNIVANPTLDVTIGWRPTQQDRPFIGTIDDVRIYDKALTPEEVQQIILGGGSEPYPFAFRPDPADGALLEATWVNLSWSPGALAVSHDVYLGESFDDVNDGAEGTFRVNQATTSFIIGFPGFPYPDGLVQGTTYYWRIDEVNDADPNSPWKGEIWSFSIPPSTAYNLSPVDGARFVDPNVTLSWTAGMDAKLHHVYFGDNFDDVNSAVVGMPQTNTTYTPGTLELDKIYYWRIDEFDGLAIHKGDVLSFRTKPFIPITDPNLVGWWTLKEGSGTIAVDWSGHGHDGTIRGNPEWVDGYDGSALHFITESDYVVHSLDGASDWPAGTVTLWIKADTVGQNEFSGVFSSYVPNSAGFQLDVDGGNPGVYRVNFSGGQISAFGTVTTRWVHLAMTFDGTSANLYYNGSWTASGTLSDTTFNQFAIGTNRNTINSIAGIIDDVRVYDKVLTEDEIKIVMKIDPLLAWEPSPANGSTPDIVNATPLTWSRGDNASQHDVYFGLDRTVVRDSNTADATGVYRGRQSATSYTPPEGVEWGTGPYYWRIDEYNTDGTISKGRVWSFTVTDFLLVDDFENYTDNDVAGEAIWQTWLDGYGIPTNGAQVGNLFPPYAEQTIVHSGFQSMPVIYNNTAGVINSEVALPLTDTRDFTEEGVKVLSLWFIGYPPSVGSFTEGPVGTYTITGSGADIGGTADQFHFAYKMLTGAGSIVAKVESVENTNSLAKAGVMIRETLDPNSKNAFVCITPANGVISQGRTDAGGTSYSATQSGLAAPSWVKLERDVAGNFTAYQSTNGSTWVMVENSTPQNILMNSNTYVGLAVTSHNAAVACEAKFSNVQITGAVGQQWAHQDIGITSNAAEPMYVALSNSTGTPAVIYHDDPNAATIDTWTEWPIDLQAFADQGLDLTNVDKIALGLGSKGNVPAPGGSGTMYFDDIRLYRPSPLPEVE